MSRDRGAHAAGQPNYYEDSRARLEAEREKTRQVTRELHEATQGALAAAKELRAAKAEIWADAQAMLQSLVHEARVALQEWAETHAGNFKEQQGQLLETLRAIDRKIHEKFAHMAGEEFTPESFRDLIERDIAATVREEFTAPGFTELVAQIVIAQLDAQTHGALSRTAHIQGQIGAQMRGTGL